MLLLTLITPPIWYNIKNSPLFYSNISQDKSQEFNKNLTLNLRNITIPREAVWQSIDPYTSR